MILRAKDVRTSFGNRRVLDGISFDVEGATVIALVGANGAGKSTLLRCLAGVTRHGGTIERFGGRAVPRRAIGYLPQALRLPREATISELTALFSGGGSAEPLPLARLPPSRGLGTLSGGEARRAALAALLAMLPRLLLLDEPTSDLDAEARDELLARLASLKAEGTTTILTSPAPRTSELESIVDRVIALEAGRAVSDRRDGGGFR